MSKVEISNLSIETSEGASLDSALIALLERSLLRVQKYLRRSAGDPMFTQRMAVAFGEAAGIDPIKKDWLEGNFAMMPSIEILTQEQLKGATGAFSGQTNRIYLSNVVLPKTNGINRYIIVITKSNHITITGKS